MLVALWLEPDVLELYPIEGIERDPFYGRMKGCFKSFKIKQLQYMLIMQAPFDAVQQACPSVTLRFAKRGLYELLDGSLAVGFQMMLHTLVQVDQTQLGIIVEHNGEQ